MLEISDDVYGSVTLTSKLLADLLASEAVWRLRMISQAGASSLVRTGRNVTRHEHSIGVMILTGILGGTEIEQAAGLLQDVSHTAFSHTIDYVFGDRQEEFHEKIFREVINSSDIPAILFKHNLTWREVFSSTNLKRVDVPAPLLCADRVDYTLRDLLRFGRITVNDANGIVNALTFTDGIVAFADSDSAATFAEWYRYLVGDIFMNPLELYSHAEMARIIREAIRLHILEEADLLRTDDIVVAKLESDKLYGLASSFRQLKNTEAVVVDDSRRGYHVYGKGRVVDPPVVVDGEVSSLSKIRPETLLSWERINEIATQGLFVRLE